MLGTIGALIALYLVWLAYRRQQGRPAARLRDGSGHMLRHPRWEKGLAWLALAAPAMTTALAIHVLRNPGSVHSPAGRAEVLLPFSLALAVLGFWSMHLVRTRIRVDDTGVTRYVGRRRVQIAWSNITRVSTDPTGALLLCSASGKRIAVHKLLVGIPTLVAYMRRHLPESMYAPVFRYYTPRAHLGLPG